MSFELRNIYVDHGQVRCKENASIDKIIQEKIIFFWTYLDDVIGYKDSLEYCSCSTGISYLSSKAVTNAHNCV